MRTTIRLDDHLLRSAKKAAAERGVTLTSLIEDALREVLARQSRPEPGEALSLPVFHGDGVRPGVDLDSTSSLLDLMDEAHDPA
ncbi:MAG: CopG family transcriptional regulator [Myxococcota bacterium]